MMAQPAPAPISEPSARGTTVLDRALTPRQFVVAVRPRLRLHVVEWGDAGGWPVVILHGGGQNACCWDDVCRRMPASLRCIVPDQRGHGDSDWPRSANYSCQAQARDLAALLDALQLARCALVGHSMGGLNALLYAARHPQRVAALVFVDVGTETGHAGMRRVRAHPQGPVELSTAAALSYMRARHPGRSLPWLRRQVRRELRRTATGIWTWKHDLRLRHFVPGYCGNQARRRHLAAAVRAPFAVMRGGRSRILSQRSAEITARIGHGCVFEIAGAGHGVPLDQPGRLASALSRFLLPLART